MKSTTYLISCLLLLFCTNGTHACIYHSGSIPPPKNNHIPVPPSEEINDDLENCKKYFKDSIAEELCEEACKRSMKAKGMDLLRKVDDESLNTLAEKYKKEDLQNALRTYLTYKKSKEEPTSSQVLLQGIQAFNIPTNAFFDQLREKIQALGPDIGLQKRYQRKERAYISHLSFWLGWLLEDCDNVLVQIDPTQLKKKMNEYQKELEDCSKEIDERFLTKLSVFLTELIELKEQKSFHDESAKLLYENFLDLYNVYKAAPENLEEPTVSHILYMNSQLFHSDPNFLFMSVEQTF